jgi:DNA-directed RNA polymerase subunit E'/Rpb7
MMRTVIPLSPALTGDLRETIHTELKKKYCTKTPFSDQGYIENIVKFDVVGNKIDQSGLVLYNVVFHYTLYKPSIGDIVSGRVCSLTNSAVLVEVKNIVKVVVNTPTPLNVKRDDVLSNIELTNVEFTKNIFNCIGKVR